MENIEQGKPAKTTTAFFRVDTSLWKDFQLLCERQETTASQALKAYLKHCLKQDSLLLDHLARQQLDSSLNQLDNSVRQELDNFKQELDSFRQRLDSDARQVLDTSPNQLDSVVRQELDNLKQEVKNLKQQSYKDVRQVLDSPTMRLDATATAKLDYEVEGMSNITARQGVDNNARQDVDNPTAKVDHEIQVELDSLPESRLSVESALDDKSESPSNLNSSTSNLLGNLDDDESEPLETTEGDLDKAQAIVDKENGSTTLPIQEERETMSDTEVEVDPFSLTKQKLDATQWQEVDHEVEGNLEGYLDSESLSNLQSNLKVTETDNVNIFQQTIVDKENDSTTPPIQESDRTMSDTEVEGNPKSDLESHLPEFMLISPAMATTGTVATSPSVSEDVKNQIKMADYLSIPQPTLSSWIKAKNWAKLEAIPKYKDEGWSFNPNNGKSGMFERVMS